MAQLLAGSRSVADDALGNSQRVSLFNYKWSLSKLGKPVDKGRVVDDAQTVNAVNFPLQNAHELSGRDPEPAVL